MKNIYINKIAIIFGLIYFAISISLMFFTYPHEDALILFRYVENFSSSGEIAFNINGEKTEGATDFLWFLILSILNFFGLNVNFSAILINSISLFFIINSLQQFFLKKENFFSIITIILILLNIGPIIGSSLFGFSSIFFIFLGFNCYLSAINKKLISWTIFSILFCLTRPEGVFLFLPTIFITYFLCSHEDKFRFYKSFFIISVTGIFYFIWRYLYFDNLLPLPLIVKSIGGETSIIRMAAIGTTVLNSFLLSLIIVIFYSFLKNFKKIFINNNIILLFLITVCCWIIFLFLLSRGVLTQNIYDRYFATFYFFIFIVFLYSFKYLHNFEKKIVLLIVVVTSIDSSNITTRLLTNNDRFLSNPTYHIFKIYNNTNGWSDHPLIRIGKTLRQEKLTIMLTEAGAIPYLSSKSKIHDIIGLNSNVFSQRPVNCKDIKNISPDIIEIDVGPLNWNSQKPRPEHLVGFDWSSFTKSKKYSDCGFHLKSEIFKDFLYHEEVVLIDKHNKTKINNENNMTTLTAPSNILICLLKNENYERIFTDKKSDQIYFVKKGKNFDFLNNSCNISKSGYFEDLFRIKN